MVKEMNHKDEEEKFTLSLRYVYWLLYYQIHY